MTKRKAPEDRHPGGRPTLYRAEYVEQAFKLCLLSATDEQLANFFGVVKSTLELWQTKHPKFSDAIARGKLRADAEIAHSLYHRGKGYSHNAVKIFMPAGAAEPVYAPYVEHYPPDTQAASLWLRNRQPRLWRDKTEHEHSGPGGGAIVQRIERVIVDAADTNREDLEKLQR